MKARKKSPRRRSQSLRTLRKRRATSAGPRANRLQANYRSAIAYSPPAEKRQFGTIHERLTALGGTDPQ
jgi:hypothetical protein